MKRFIVSILCAAVFFIGLGGLIERTRATFKSDEKALELIRQARQAIGGDNAVGNARSMTIIGKATKTLDIDGAVRNEQGDVEINFELPNKMSRMMKIGGGDAAFGDKQFDVMIMRQGGEDDNLQWKTEAGDQPNLNGDNVKKVIVTKQDGTVGEIRTEGKEQVFVTKPDVNQVVTTSEGGQTGVTEGQKVFTVNAREGGNKLRQNELLRTTLSLLLSAPEGVDVSYVYIGEGSVDGNSCEIVEAQTGGAGYKLYLDKSSHLLRMMTFQGIKPFIMIFKKSDSTDQANQDTQTFTRQLPEPQPVEFQVKFSDFRSVNGLQLPFRWVQTIGGKDDETIDVTSVEINPAGIAEKFKDMPTKIMIRQEKPQK